MSEVVNGTTAPWLLAGIGILVLLTFIRTIGAWRETKRSPYYFLRQQAERKLQACLWCILGLMALAGGTVAFAWQTPVDETVRMALLSNSKPVAESAAGDTDDLPTLSFAESPANVEMNIVSPPAETIPVSGTVESLPEGLAGSSVRPGEGGALEFSLAPTLPEEFDQYEPTAELTADTELTSVVFSTEIDDNYKAIGPRRTFGEGFITVYATFDYLGMADGMEWAWVWRRNGEVVNGGNELWAYGDEGPGWIYFEPPEGFAPGDYTLEVWVNGELMQRASMTIESEVANQ